VSSRSASPTGGPTVPDRARRSPGDGDDYRRPPSGSLFGAVTALLVFLLLVLGLVLLDDTDGDVAVEPALTGAPVATDQPPPAEEVTPTPEPEIDPTGIPPAEPTDRPPTDADAAMFASTYEPPGARDPQSVTVDITGGGSSEVVVVSIAGELVRLDVAVWTGQRYEVAFTDSGGPAEEITGFTVRDVTGDGVREIVTAQQAERRSLSLWGWDGTAFARQTARGGCWDGSHVYGVDGAEVDDGELVATCDPLLLDLEPGTRHVYVWDGQAWSFDRVEGA
jgi:hypothetical protein